MTLIITENTYPEVRGVAHAKPGDLVKWELSKGCYRLIRQSDMKVLFVTARVNKDGLLISNNKPPKLFGTIAEVKTRGWVMKVDRQI